MPLSKGALVRSDCGTRVAACGERHTQHVVRPGHIRPERDHAFQAFNRLRMALFVQIEMGELHVGLKEIREQIDSLQQEVLRLPQ